MVLYIYNGGFLRKYTTNREKVGHIRLRNCVSVKVYFFLSVTDNVFLLPGFFARWTK